MISAFIKNINGMPTIVIDDKAIPGMAYITYRPEYNCYEDFAGAGVKLYSVNLNFSEMPINEMAPVIVFQKGIFENEIPDYSIVDKNFGQILDACPDAYIFPRVNMNLCESWEKMHPDELCEKGFGERKRFSYASDLWAEEVKSKLSALVEYIENSRYADRVIGYQIAAGNTEEWLPIDPGSGYGLRAKEKFELYCSKNNAVPCEEEYYRFMSGVIVDRIKYLSAVVKKLTSNKKLVGTFYGYTLETGRNTCHQALSKLLECKDIDFLCSPVTYTNLRAPGYDLYHMIPVGSLHNHGKFYFSENDIRTHLTRLVNDHPHYKDHPIWYGREKKITTEQMKLVFCRAMLYGYGMWWFDMWGGWYKEGDYMGLISRMSEISAGGMDKSDSEIAFFVDEEDHLRSTEFTGFLQKTMSELGRCGAPFDVYLLSDFEAVFENYHVCIFATCCDNKKTKDCAKAAESSGKLVKCITIGNEITASEIHAWFISEGAEMPVSRSAVVYRGKNYISLYTPEDGEYDFCDRGNREFVDLFTGETVKFPTFISKAKAFLFERQKNAGIDKEIRHDF